MRRRSLTEHPAPKPFIPVVAGLIRDARGRVLLAQRPARSDQGGLWEFPGGKVEDGEQAHTALARELREELGIGITTSSPLASVRYEYPEKSIQLLLRRVHGYDGTLTALEGQALQWLAVSGLPELSMPAADRQLLGHIGLHERYVISGSCREASDFHQALNTVLARGERLIQLRQPGSGAKTLRPLVREAAALCAARGARLLINEHVELAADLAGVGVHLKSHQLMAMRSRPLPGDRLVGASCHNRHEIERACELELDFVCLSPVLDTGSHPGAVALGWAEFSRLCASSGLPVFALGGMNAGHLHRAHAAGAHGIAGISGFWPV